MPSLGVRFAGPELMDDAAMAPREIAACLADLERLNRLTGAYAATLAWLGRLFRARQESAPLVIVDVGCGHGDMLRRIAAFSARRGRPVTLIGIDANPHAIAAARNATPADLPIQWCVGDALNLLPEQRCDIVVSSLLTHHLDDAAV